MQNGNSNVRRTRIQALDKTGSPSFASTSPDAIKRGPSDPAHDVWKRNCKLGMTSVTFREKSIAEIIDIARAAELSVIEWGGDRHVPPGDEAAIREAAALMHRHEISCPSYGSYYRLGENDPARFRLICTTAQALGATTIRTWLGTKGSAQTSAEERAALVLEAQMLADIAAESSLTLAFEFHGKTLNDTGESGMAFLRDCGKENIKTYWQPLASGNSEENLRTVLPALCTVHVFNWDTEYRRYPLADAEDEWRRYVSIIKNACRPCPFLLEFVRNDSDEQFLLDAKALRRILSD